MQESRALLRIGNFDLAFRRIQNSSNWQYKSFNRHLLTAFDLSRKANIRHLIADIRSNAYEPSNANLVYFPKSSGVLRPLALLTVRDQLVYQALVNIVASKFKKTQTALKDKKTFGAIYAGATSPFFYRNWRLSYQAFNTATVKSFNRGRNYYSEFDLVSFYEIIDHNILRGLLRDKGLSEEFLDILFRCISKWTTNSTAELHHGIPQGPLSSAFLAECLLFEFDQRTFPGVTYLRYVDDIRLLAAKPQPILRALISLDLASKQYGLVPQAQKITKPRKARDSGEIIKTIPSMYVDHRKLVRVSQSALWSQLRGSLSYRRKSWSIEDKTNFKYALNRMVYTKRVLSIVEQLAPRYPDLSENFATFMMKCGPNAQARDAASKLLSADPVYDSVAALYIDVIQTCNPGKPRVKDLRLVKAVLSRSVEKSVTVQVAAGQFIALMRGPRAASALIERTSCPIAKGLLIERLFASGRFSISGCRAILAKNCSNQDADLARYCATLILTSLLGTKIPGGRSRNKAVSLMLHDLGLTRIRPTRSTVLEVFFKEKLGIQTKVNWSRAFGTHRMNVEEKCLRMQKLTSGDPSTRITFVDAFNDLLLQYFCRAHPSLKTAYHAATKPNHHHPDMGAWLNQANLGAIVPATAAWFKRVHEARLSVDLAHSVKQSGPNKGQFTKPLSRREASEIMKGQRRAYMQLLQAWKRI